MKQASIPDRSARLNWCTYAPTDNVAAILSERIHAGWQNKNPLDPAMQYNLAGMLLCNIS